MRRVLTVIRREPVRVWLYGTLGPIFGVLFVYGIVDQIQATTWIALGGGILAVPGTESVRAMVSPVAGLGARPHACGIVSPSGPFGEPLGCAYPTGHDGPHSWSTLPTFPAGASSTD